MREAIAPARGSVRPHAIVLSLMSDERLAKLAATGDSIAFTTIYQRYHGPLYRYCRSIVGSPDDASDALQNTMLSAFRSLQGEIRSIRLKPWLYKIAHNESISVLRARRPSMDLEAAARVAGSDMAVDAATRERLRQLMTDVSKLSEQQRGALLMRELNGLEYQEIGAALGTSESAAKQSVHEARSALTDAELGRDMACASIRAIVSERDGRQLRARRVRAHLDDCPSCSTFRASIVTRRRDLAAFVPVIPATTAAAALKGAFGGAAAGEASGLAALLGGGAAGGTAAKGAAIAAVAATMGIGTYAYVEKQQERQPNRTAASDLDDRGDFSPPHANRVIRPAGAKHDPSHAGGLASTSDKHKFKAPDPKPRKEKMDTAFVAQITGDGKRDVVVHEPEAKDEPKPKVPEEAPTPDKDGGKDRHGGGDGSVQEPKPDKPEDALPDNLDDLLAGDLADLIDNYSKAFLAGNFSSSDINEIINRYTGIVKDYTGGELARQISSGLDGSGITAMLEKLTGTRTPSSAQPENLVSRLLPNLGSLLP